MEPVVLIIKVIGVILSVASGLACGPEGTHRLVLFVVTLISG
jgi:H+/Cl- antiporter ClcA